LANKLKKASRGVERPNIPNIGHRLIARKYLDNSSSEMLAEMTNKRAGQGWEMVDFTTCICGSLAVVEGWRGTYGGFSGCSGSLNDWRSIRGTREGSKTLAKRHEIRRTPESDALSSWSMLKKSISVVVHPNYPKFTKHTIATSWMMLERSDRSLLLRLSLLCQKRLHSLLSQPCLDQAAAAAADRT